MLNSMLGNYKFLFSFRSITWILATFYQVIYYITLTRILTNIYSYKQLYKQHYNDMQIMHNE